MAITGKDKTIFRVLITQINPDGSIKTKNIKNEEGEIIRENVPMIGGVVKDNLGKALGYVFDQSRYDNDLNRNPKDLVYDWYRKEENVDENQG